MRTTSAPANRNAAPRPTPSVSVVIDNYNYDRFLREAIDSALAQGYPDAEVVVVDDGSTDGSRDVIAGYGGRIVPVLKNNGGQASAFNAGFAASRGDVVIYLDSDDLLFPGAIEKIVAKFDGDSVAKVHWPLEIIDETGRRTGRRKPPVPPPSGNFRDLVLERGPSHCQSPPTSGNAWARWFLDRVMPAPEDVAYYRICADEYLYTLAAALGDVRSVVEPQGAYRIHGRNIYSARTFREKLALEVAGHEQQREALARVLDRLGVTIDRESWRRHSWFHRLEEAVGEVERLVPEGDHFVLIDDGTWDAAAAFDRRRPLPFIERDGRWWGPPENDEIAIAELDRMRQAGARRLIVAWPAFWWREHYGRFFDHVRARCRCIARGDLIEAYDLDVPPAAGGGG